MMSNPCRRDLHLRSALIVADGNPALYRAVKSEYRAHVAACPTCRAWFAWLAAQPHSYATDADWQRHAAERGVA